jgi:4-hydroxy-3-methylbut-2-enyl diphosphate reductase IspH
MKTRALVLIALLLVAACSKVTQENFSKIQDGMSEAEVHAILGKPTESNSAQILGISGTSSKWVGSDAEITIRFLGGKLALKSYDKPGAKK